MQSRNHAEFFPEDYRSSIVYGKNLDPQIVFDMNYPNKGVSIYETIDRKMSEPREEVSVPMNADAFDGSGNIVRDALISVFPNVQEYRKAAEEAMLKRMGK
jgi:hypothetical protein